MRRLIEGLYCGFGFGFFYFFVELVWNHIFDKLVIQLSLFVSFLAYIAGFGILGLVVSFSLFLLPNRADVPQQLRLIRCSWLCTFVTGSFFGSMFLISRLLFMHSWSTKSMAIVVMSGFAAALCYFIYRLIQKIFSDIQGNAVLFHYAGLFTINIFLIMAIKLNMQLRSPPFSSQNLFWDVIILFGSVALCSLCFWLFHIFRQRLHGSVHGLGKAMIVCIGIGIVWGIYSLTGNEDRVILNTGKSLQEENMLPNIILITLDTVRADHLSIYGYNRVTSPKIDKFAEDGVRFENAMCQIPLTRPSHFSILTGLYPLSHGLIDNFTETPRDIRLISDTMKQQGYKTAAFVSATILNSGFNTRFGFEEYYDEIKNIIFDHHFLLMTDLKYLGVVGIKSENSARETNHRVFEWLEQNKEGPFFLWVHYFDPHTPYKPEEKYRKSFTDRDLDIHKYYDYEWEKAHYDPRLKEVSVQKDIVQHAIDLYDAEIRGMDAELGILFERLRGLNLYENSLIILTADHGESFEKRYYFDHGDRLYEGLIRVPLVLKFPLQKYRGKSILTQVELIDIAPTILQFLSSEPLQGIEGRSLLPVITGKESDPTSKDQHFSYSQTPYRGAFFFKAKELQSLRTNQWKFIFNLKTEEQELYNLTHDPKEEYNLNSLEPAVSSEFRTALKKFDTRSETQKGPPQEIKLDETTKEQLKSLGYVN